MKKVILKLDFHDDKAKHKAMKMVSSVTGIDSIAVNMKEKTMTVLGDIDPIQVVIKLRKICRADILSVGPAKEPEKKKDEPKKEEAKKDSGKKYEDKKDVNDQVAELVKLYKAYNPHMTTYYYVHSIEENPNACVIC